MQQLKVNILLLLFFTCNLHMQQGYAQVATDTAFNFEITDTLKSDSVIPIKINVKSTLLDTILSDSILLTIFHPYVRITQPYVKIQSRRTGITGIKEIQNRPKRRDQWRFWVICVILIYISFVRISHPNDFNVFIQSVFNVRLSDKIWEEQRSVFNFITLHMFTIYLLIAAIFINSYFEQNRINFTDNYFLQYLLVAGICGAVYISKFLLHSFLGALLSIKKLGVGFISNTISVSNFLALVIFPFIIFYAYNTNQLWSVIMMQTIIALFLISIVYRILRILVLSHSFFTFPIMYLFIYLCALEILPIVVIVKFINTYTI
jgi:hypothetical protein